MRLTKNSLKNQLSRLEKETAINKPCRRCEVQNLFIEEVVRLEKERGIFDKKSKAFELRQKPARNSKSKEISVSFCEYCGRPSYLSLSGYSEQAKETILRYDYLKRKGLLHAPENENIFRECRDVLAFSDSDEVKTIAEEIIQEVGKKFAPIYDELTRKLKKRKPYICRLNGCNCQSKTK